MVKRIKVVAAIIMLTIMIGNEAFANDLLKESEDIPEVYNGVNGTNEEKKDSFEVLLDKQYSIEQFEQTVTNLYPGVVLSAVEEIMLIHIELPESVEKEEFLNNKEIREFIYAQGELPDISIPLNPLQHLFVQWRLQPVCQFKLQRHLKESVKIQLKFNNMIK